MSARPMTAAEQAEHFRLTRTVRSCVTALRLSRLADDAEDVAVALARLENWLAENEGRWTR